MRGIINKVSDIVLNAAGIALLLIAFAIGLGVFMNIIGSKAITSFDNSYLLIGNRISFNTLLGIQVLLFSFAIMASVPFTWLKDQQVRVDFIYRKFSERKKHILNLLGNVVLALPFLGFLIPSTMDFALSSFAVDESSRDGGLEDIYIIKAMIPAGFFVMGLACVYLTINNILFLISKR